jgi:hypothetical protein
MIGNARVGKAEYADGRADSSGMLQPSLYWQALLVFALLLVARTLAIYSVYFYEEDEISLAAGVAALVRNNVGDLYRYTPQLGYYRLVEGIDLLLGGDVTLIPWIGKGLAAVAGALIPTLGLFAFRNVLSLPERWLLVLSLAINPIIWKSSQYGNTAIVAAAIATSGLVMLSNSPARSGRMTALGLIGVGTLVRADAVLLVPIALYLLFRQTKSLRATLMWGAAFGLVMAAVYGVAFAIDPRIDSAVSAVARHMSIDRRTQFWEYLLWAMSPIPLVLATWGMRTLFMSRPGLFASLALWCVPTMLFYFKATTTPRYFLNCAVPLSVAAAIAVAEIAGRVRFWCGAPLAWVLAAGLASAHLFVAVGQFSSMDQFLSGAFIITDDRAMPTGALLRATYSDRDVLGNSWPDPEFGRRTEPYWEPIVFTRALEILADEAIPRRTVIILLGGGWPHAFHYHAQAAGARYVSRVSAQPSVPFASETWLELGNARIMTVNARTEHYQAVSRFDVANGDFIWAFGNVEFPDSEGLSKLPPGLSLVPEQTSGTQFRIFRVTDDKAHP